MAINIPTTAVDVQAAPSMPFQGNTNATVNSQFPVVMDWEFETYPAAQLNAQLAVMGDIELARFSQMYYVATGGNTATLLMYAAQKLTAANLVRFASAFGAAATGTAVNLYAPAAVQSTYATTPARALIKESHAQHASVGAVSMTVNGLASGVAAPTVWMTPYEIYTEFIFTSAETELGALALTLRYMTVELTTAWGIGWKAGSAYYAFGESMDPDFAINLPLIYADAEANEFGPIDGSTVVPDGTAWIDDPSFYDFNDTTFTQAQ